MANTTPVTYEKGKLYDLNIADVQPDPDQPRKYFDEQALSGYISDTYPQFRNAGIELDLFFVCDWQDNTLKEDDRQLHACA